MKIKSTASGFLSMKWVLTLVLTLCMVFSSVQIVFSTNQFNKNTWIITNSESYSNANINVSQLTVKSGGALTLNACTLTFDGTGGLLVLKGGKLLLKNCTIQAANPTKGYFVYIEADIGVFDTCTISGMGNPPKEYGDRIFNVKDCKKFSLINSQVEGYVNLDSVTDSTISGNRFDGICTGNGDRFNLPVDPAITLDQSRNISITNNTMYAYSIGISLWYSWDNLIENNT